MSNPFETPSAEESKKPEPEKIEKSEQHPRASAAPKPLDISLLPETIIRKKESLGYEPFDATVELLKFRKNRHKLDKAEQKKRLEFIKDELMRQEEGLSEIIADLRRMIKRTPDVSKERLFDYVKQAGRKYRLKSIQLLRLNSGINRYEEAHNMVDKYRELYPRDEDLFEACFGRHPHGKVDVQKGPSTLFFRCFDKSDYALVANYGRIGGDESKLTQEHLNWSDKTIGVALDRVKQEELEKTVTAEFAGGALPEYRIIKNVPHLERLKAGGESRFEIDSIDSRVLSISFGDEAKFIMHLGQRDFHGRPTRLWLKNVRSLQTRLLDLRREHFSGDEEHGSLIDVLSPTGGRSLKHGAILRSGKRLFGEITIFYNHLEIKSAYAGEARINWSQSEGVLFPSSQSEFVGVHEEQHQFNNFWEPLEFGLDVEEIMRRVATRAESPAKAKDDFLRLILKKERAELGIDSRGRDEILAYYQEGRDLKEIYQILSESHAQGGIYDPIDVFKSGVEKLPARVYENLFDKSFEVYFQQFVDIIADTTGVPKESAWDALKIKKDDIEALIKPVFGEDYRRDLWAWVEAVALLQRKGYKRVQIMSLLYAEPASSWPALSRRMPEWHTH